MMELKFEDVREELRKWREDNSRHSEEVLERWTSCISNNKHKLGDERWMVEEQVLIAALDCNMMDIARPCLYSLEKKFPESMRVLKLKGMHLEAQQKYDEAMKVYDIIIRQEETNSTARKRKVSVLRSQMRYTDAIKELTEYLKIFMSDHEAWQELADLYLKEGDYGKAAYCMEELLLANPHNAIFYTRYAEIRYTQGGLENLDLAKYYFAQAVKLNPRNARALFGLELTCQQVASHNKTSGQKKKDALKLAAYATQLISQMYTDMLSDSSEHEELLDNICALSITDK